MLPRRSASPQNREQAVSDAPERCCATKQKCGGQEIASCEQCGVLGEPLRIRGGVQPRCVGEGVRERLLL
ncbi:hypothetical protein M3J09_001790 [Ascochyta lentis]